MTFKFCYILFILTCLHLIAPSMPSCFPCDVDDPFASYNSCAPHNPNLNPGSKIVELSGLCARSCDDPARSCSHQIGRIGRECQFFGSYGKEGCSPADVGSWPILQCDGPSGKCQCPPTVSGHVPLEDHVVITAYPFECCAPENQFTAAPDIVITNTGWRELAVVSTSSTHEWWCGQFRLTEDASGRRLRYDCPTHVPLEQGRAVSLQICTSDHTASYRFNLPYLANISHKILSVESWEPMIAVHTHRSDKLVYSVQRSPPRLNITEYDVQLVRCEVLDCSGQHHTIQGTERRVKEMPSASERHPGVFKLMFDVPEEAGNISLLVQPLHEQRVRGRPTLSAVLCHPGKNTAQMAIFASVLVLFLVLAIVAVVWFKFFYKSTEPARVEVLVLYNSNAGLARHVARQLETHCMVHTMLDVVDIPRASAGMDPVEWLTSELQRCQTVLLLVFPENAAPPIYPRLYPSAVHHLHMDAGRKRVVIGYAGGRACAPLPQLPSARLCRLPAQLAILARAVRGAAWVGKGCLDARELARRLTTSEGGRTLAAMLERPTKVPPPETTPLPVDETTPLPPLPLMLLPKAPLRNEHELAPHIPSTDIVLDPLTPNGKGDPPVDDADSDADIEWH